MKKMMVVLAVAALSLVAQANMITNNPGFDGCAWQYTVPGWGVYADGAWNWDGVGGNGGVLALGWTDGKCVWQNTVDTVQANTIYRLSAVVKSVYEAGTNPIQSEGVQLILQDADAGYVNIVTKNFWFSDLGDTFGTTGPWRTVSMDLDSSVYSSVVGHKLCVAIANKRTNTWGGWGSACIDEMSLDVVPEPATMALLGLGGLFMARRRS